MVTTPVEQAVFTSVRSAQINGYHLVGRSHGITDPLAQVICRWSPSHNGLCDSDLRASSLNFHELDSGHYSISRSVYGGPEYSGRGGLQTVTMTMVVTRPHLSQFDFDVLAFTEIALSMGCMRLSPPFNSRLATIDFPHQPLLRRRPQPRNGENETVEEVLKLLDNDRCVAVVGATNPIPLLRQVIDQTPIDRRADLSFTTGLRHSTIRDFRLHFLPQADLKTRSELSNERIALVKAG